MPKMPGRESTRKTIPIEQATIANFVMPWMRETQNKPCCIQGCSHKADGNQGTLAKPEWCSISNAASIYDERKMPGPKPDPYVGLACPCCVDKLLADGT